MSAVSLRLPEELDRRLSREVRLSGQPRSQLIREALEALLSRRERERSEAAMVAMIRRGCEVLPVHGAARDRLQRDSHAMAEQPRALDRTRIGEGPLTHLRGTEMVALEQALGGAMGDGVKGFLTTVRSCTRAGRHLHPANATDHPGGIAATAGNGIRARAGC